MKILRKNCIICKKSFKKSPKISYERWFKKTKFCSFSCHGKSILGHIPWNKGLKGIHLSRETEFKKGIEPWNKGKTHLVEDKNPAWKGDKVGYVALHSWVRRKLGKPNKCEHCKQTVDNTYNIQWANKSGKYLRDLKDWIRLCRLCHEAYDRQLVL